MQSAVMTTNFDSGLMEIIKYQNDYAKYKQHSATPPVAPVNRRWYKLSNIKAVYDVAGSNPFDLSKESGLIDTSYVFKLTQNQNYGKIVGTFLVALLAFFVFLI
jgi:tetrahydromethanopterin S-methyltransferase subunit B